MCLRLHSLFRLLVRFSLARYSLRLSIIHIQLSDYQIPPLLDTSYFCSISPSSHEFAYFRVSFSDLRRCFRTRAACTCSSTAGRSGRSLRRSSTACWAQSSSWRSICRPEWFRGMECECERASRSLWGTNIVCKNVFVFHAEIEIKYTMT